jgi:hypothetical protein
LLTDHRENLFKMSVLTRRFASARIMAGLRRLTR